MSPNYIGCSTAELLSVVQYYYVYEYQDASAVQKGNVGLHPNWAPGHHWRLTKGLLVGKVIVFMC